MTDKWLDIAKKRMRPGDAKIGSWAGVFNHMEGHIVLSNETFLFIEDQGLINRTVKLLLDLPYRKMSKINTEKHGRLTITDTDGENYRITSEYLSYFEKKLKNLMKHQESKA